jgi:hydroxyquinol 1,2-dioxygenase
MRTVSADTLTQAVRATLGPATEPRLVLILTSLLSHLHAFARETRLTHAEWRRGIELLTACGQISTAERNEVVLLSDVLGLSSLVDMIASPAGATPSSVLGPFHILGAPPLAYGGDLVGDHAGDALVVSGTVRRTTGAPIAGARIELWQTAANGLYSNQDPAQAPFDFRARLATNADGRFLLSTVRPAPYTVPTDGPVGDLLRAVGRHPWRPSHLHLIVDADGCRQLVTELFPADDPWLDQDAVFGVREALVLAYERVTDPAELPAELIRPPALPCWRVDHDLVLADA